MAKPETYRPAPLADPSSGGGHMAFVARPRNAAVTRDSGAGAGRQTSELTLESSDSLLVEAFNWAKRQAMAYVFDGDPVGPWYEAALPGRQTFCMRDTAHQCLGAQALGLARYTHNMPRRFAENIADFHLRTVEHARHTRRAQRPRAERKTKAKTRTKTELKQQERKNDNDGLHSQMARR